jgi:hypothetical protein
LNDLGKARQVLLQCEPLARELPEVGRLAWIQQNLAVIAQREGDYDEARMRLEQSHALFEQIGGRWQAINALDGLGFIAVAQGRIHDARQILHDCLPAAMSLGAHVSVVSCLTWAAGIAFAEKLPGVAARLLAAAEAISERQGFEIEEFDWPSTNRAAQERLRSDFAVEWNAGRAMSVEEAVTLALE